MNRTLTLATLALATMLALTACFTGGPRETLAGFRLELPASASERQVLPLSVLAVGSDGARPFAGFGGEARLSVSRGTIAPDRLAFEAGRATTEVILRGALGPVEVTVTGGGASGTHTIELMVLTALPGDPDEPAADAIPEIKFEPREQDYRDDHPNLAGAFLSFNTLLAVFDLDATVAEVNAVLDGVGAEIVAGVPGRAGQVPGIAFLQVPTSSHEEMIALLEGLRANPLVEHVVQDSLLEPPEAEAESVSPQISTGPNGGFADWTWELEASGGNWGLERIRVPQMWNLNAAVGKTGGSTVTGVLDTGFAHSHPDLAYEANLTPTEEADHGTHVAGIIGATFGNGLGVDGVNPFARLMVAEHEALAGLPESESGSIFERRQSMGLEMIGGLFALIEQLPTPRIVNISLGYNWYRVDVDTSSTLGPDAIQAKLLAFEQGAIVATRLAIASLTAPPPLIVVAAGNDSNTFVDPSGAFNLQQAKYSSPFASAALLHGRSEIIVVEAVSNWEGVPSGATRTGFSNVGGHVSAPGRRIYSTSWPTPFQEMKGTSMAAPHVTGLAGYLLGVDPTLTRDELRQLLLENTVVVDPVVPADERVSPRIDAFAAALDIDRVQGGDRVLRMLLDVDDGTPDGNRRLEPGSASETVDEDADLDGGVGDGVIDMSDFRRFRDWLLQVEADADLALDGSAEHPKKDLNGNGVNEPPEAENVYPRGDFNGDGVLNRAGTGFVPGAVGEEATDLEVLEVLFDDLHYQPSQLEALLDSGDITFDLAACFGLPGAAAVRTSVWSGGSLIEEFEHSHGDLFVHTVPPASGGYRVAVEVRDADGEILGVQEHDTGPLGLGGDLFWQPACVPAVVEVTFPEVVEPGTPTPLLVRTGLRLADGSVEYQQDWFVELHVQGGAAHPDNDFTDADGFFDSQVTAEPDSETLTLFVTVFDDNGDLLGTTVVSAEVAGADPLFLFTFDDDFDGWQDDTSGKALDEVDHSNFGNPDGSVKLNGSDFGVDDDEPNSWISRTLSLPADTGHLGFDASADPNGAADPLNDAALRVRLVDAGGAVHTLRDWEILVGIEWHRRSVDLSSFAGQTVTIYFEQDDDGEGVGEFIFLDNVRIDEAVVEPVD